MPALAKSPRRVVLGLHHLRGHRIRPPICSLSATAIQAERYLKLSSASSPSERLSTLRK
jgi:hypothetical protein